MSDADMSDHPRSDGSDDDGHLSDTSSGPGEPMRDDEGDVRTLPLWAQRRIANLEQKIARLEEKVANLERVNANLRTDLEEERARVQDRDGTITRLRRIDNGRVTLLRQLLAKVDGNCDRATLRRIILAALDVQVPERPRKSAGKTEQVSMGRMKFDMHTS